MSSVLNPEAPEFTPYLKSATQEGYTHVHKTIRVSNKLPLGQSYDLFKTFTDFNSVSSQLSENVVSQSNQIIVTELAGAKLKKIDLEHNIEKIADSNDSMLDRVNINIDTVIGVNKPQEFTKDTRQANVSAWNTSPVITKIQMGSTTFIGAKNITRPQLLFKDPIDNSESLWVPKISDKPNNIKPLALRIRYNEEGEAIGYEHPYKVELELYHPPMDVMFPGPDPNLPPPLDQTTYTYVATEKDVDDLVKHLDQVKEIAVDMEHHSYRTYQGITCLIQISTDEGGDFVIDALAVREHLHKLNLAFTDPRKIKVFHGADMDVLWLQRDFGVYIVGLFDTHQAAKALKHSRLSLKHLLMRYCNLDADKKYQLADWRIRPLPNELIEYARMDTHYLLYIWRKMRNELLEAGSGKQHILFSVFDRCRHISKTTYSKTVVDDNSHFSLYVQSKKSFNSQQIAALQMLYKWRDSQARELDESVTYLLPNHMLLALAENLPREVQGVNACCSPMPPFVKQNLITIHRMILSCRELPVEPQLYQMPASISQMLNVTQQAMPYDIHDLSQWPDWGDDAVINLDQTAEFLFKVNLFQPDIKLFMPQSIETYPEVQSNLNAEAKLFIPPYDRYRKYRSLAQIEELKEFKEKEAKIAALGKGNELIKSEVLEKLQQAQVKKEENNVQIDLTDSTSKGVQRKRKISQKSDAKETIDLTETTNDPKPDKNIKNSKPEGKTNVKPYAYKNADYKKFYANSEKKKPKAKFKKHK